MKKPYEKPGLLVESFALSQSIATSCVVNRHNSTVGSPTFSDVPSCGWSDGLSIIWVSEPACNEFYPNNAELDIGCYNGPAGDYTVFSS